MKIIHFYPNFDNIGGAQSMVFTIFEGMKAKNHNVKICGFTPYDKIHHRYRKNILKEEYIPFSFFKIHTLKHNILISHHRKITTYLLILSKIFFAKINIIHIAHNEFFNLKRMTLFPKKIIAVSNRVKQNLTDVFGVNPTNIKVVYNGIQNDLNTQFYFKLHTPIQIVYPARINSVKKQLKLVQQIKNSNINNIVIHFCGDGEQLNQLKELAGTDKRFNVKGMVENMKEVYQNADFTLLFTEKEGLPVSLIESCKYGLPIICNDVGGNLEIVTPNHNGYVVNTYNELITQLEKLNHLSQEEYNKLCSNSKEVFIEKFTQEKMIIDYLNYISV